MIIKNETSTTEINAVNKHLMEHALQYVEEVKKNKNVKSKALKKTNYARMFKRVILPCETLGLSGRKDAQCGRCSKEKVL